MVLVVVVVGASVVVVGASVVVVGASVVVVGASVVVVGAGRRGRRRLDVVVGRASWSTAARTCSSAEHACPGSHEERRHPATSDRTARPDRPCRCRTVTGAVVVVVLRSSSWSWSTPALHSGGYDARPGTVEAVDAVDLELGHAVDAVDDVLQVEDRAAAARAARARSRPGQLDAKPICGGRQVVGAAAAPCRGRRTPCRCSATFFDLGLLDRRGGLAVTRRRARVRVLALQALVPALARAPSTSTARNFVVSLPIARWHLLTGEFVPNWLSSRSP